MAAPRICSIEGCDKPAYKRGMCNAHYIRWRRHGDALAGGKPRAPRGASCSIEGCDAPVKAIGYCAKHHQRWLVHGDARGGKGTHWGEPERFLNEVILPYDGDGCLTSWPYSRDQHGYPQTSRNGIRVRVGRIVCEAVHGAPPTPKHHAAHSCGNGHLGCLTKSHLRWATPKQNAADKFFHGTQPLGEQNPSAKLTENDVREIRYMASRMLLREVAAIFGVDISHVAKIVRRVSWKHIK